MREVGVGGVGGVQVEVWLWPEREAPEIKWTSEIVFDLGLQPCAPTLARPIPKQRR